MWKNHFFKMKWVYIGMAQSSKRKKQGVISQLRHTNQHDTNPIPLFY